jgi:sugar phosphate isomerase/epimerase
VANFCISEFGNPEHHLARARELSFGFETQVFCDPHRLDERQSILPALRSKLVGLASLSLHGPFSDLAPASRDPRIVDVTHLRFRQAHDAAMELGAQRVVVHSGFVPKTYALEVWNKNTAVFWKELLRDLKAHLFFHIENVYEDDPRMLARLIDDIASPQVSICLDTGHVNANSTRPMEEWITTLNSRIRHVHLHNNGGVYDDHDGLAHGTLDMMKVFELLNQHCPEAVLALETKDLEGSLQWMREKGILP